ncbi:NETI motif-containing protein [Bacillus fonticola]|uniref:NETI motif-containing protein n=1 Tax=Bacillus fonticola TaxID=2728853 RepID=UPI001472EE02|nr:NETI motif-containing protein [Bacillus fonticola]
MSKQKKVWFSVEEGENIASCLERMDREGYRPIRRMEKPLFKEEKGEKVPVSSEIRFQGELKTNN